MNQKQMQAGGGDIAVTFLLMLVEKAGNESDPDPTAQAVGAVMWAPTLSCLLVPVLCPP